jgi:hypothetical protein
LETEAGGLPVGGQPGLHSDTLTQKPKKKKKKKTKKQKPQKLPTMNK